MSWTHLLNGRFALVGLLLVCTRVADASEVAQRVPPAALGYVVISDLTRFDERVASAAEGLGLPLPRPLALMRATTGIGDGLEVDGELLLAMLPPRQASSAPRFAVWLPVSDFPAFLASLQGETEERISAVTIAGEDLLVAQHGAWALIMDPTERSEMERILTSAPHAEMLPEEWTSWNRANDITCVVLANGIRAILAWAADPRGDSAEGGDSVQEIPIDERDRGGWRSGPLPIEGFTATIRRALYQSARDSQSLARLAMRSKAIAAGARLDEEGNLLGGIRLAWQSESPLQVAEPQPSLASLPQSAEPALIALAGGTFPPMLTTEMSKLYARWLVRGLEEDTRSKIDPRDADDFVEAMEGAAALVEGISLSAHFSDQADGVYSNSFALVRVDRADTFLERASDVMRVWNELNYDLRGDMKLVFDTKRISIGRLEGTEYSIDMAAAVGAAELPEVRQAMEKLFGPEGKLRLILCALDEGRVLLANGTSAQAERMIAALEQGGGAGPQPEPIETTSALLPPEAAWRIFFSPHGYSNWLESQMNAVVGPVIGGPAIRDFPASPPIGAAGGFSRSGAWVDVAVPRETLESGAVYWKSRSE